MITNALNRLNDYLEKVPLKFLELPEAMRLQRPPSGKWSKQEILGHLIDSALHNWQRMAIANESEGTYVASPYLQAELVKNNGYQQLPAKQITALWKTMNQQLLEVCQRLTDEQLKKEILLPYADNLMTDLVFLINDYVDHMEHHLKQIFGSLDVLDRVEGWQMSTKEAKTLLEQQAANRFITLKERGSLLVEYYAPQDIDPQQPHRQDELYVVIQGNGQFYCDGERKPFKAGDVLFVPAGIDHRFEDFSEDFSTWVIFYGPDGGEIPVDKHWLKEQKIGDKIFQISTKKSQLDLEVIYGFLKNSYWANQRSKAVIKKSLDHCLSFGLYQAGKQIGLARVVTDYSVFGYVADVFILEEFRGLGLGKWLIDTVVEHPSLEGIKWFLVTKDMHRLYEGVGFAIVEHPDRIMEMNRK